MAKKVASPLEATRKRADATLAELHRQETASDARLMGLRKGLQQARARLLAERHRLRRELDTLRGPERRPLEDAYGVACQTLARMEKALGLCETLICHEPTQPRNHSDWRPGATPQS